MLVQLVSIQEVPTLQPESTGGIDATDNSSSGRIPKKTVLRSVQGRRIALQHILAGELPLWAERMKLYHGVSPHEFNVGLYLTN